MNCQTVRNAILALPDPRRVPESLRAHAAGCGRCRYWAEQAGRLESLLERLPVPPAPGDKRAVLLDELARDAATAEPAAPRRQTVREFMRANTALVGGLAAALLVAGGWVLFGGGGAVVEVARAGPRDPFLDKVVRRDVALAKAATPAETLTALGDLADDLAVEARGLARIATPDELRDIAGWFDRVVTDGVVRQAGRIPPQAMSPREHKERLEALAGKLAGTVAEVEKLGGEVGPEAGEALRRIARTARDGETKLRELARQGV